MLGGGGEHWGPATAVTGCHNGHMIRLRNIYIWDANMQPLCIKAHPLRGGIYANGLWEEVKTEFTATPPAPPPFVIALPIKLIGRTKHT